MGPATFDAMASVMTACAVLPSASTITGLDVVAPPSAEGPLVFEHRAQPAVPHAKAPSAKGAVSFTIFEVVFVKAALQRKIVHFRIRAEGCIEQV